VRALRGSGGAAAEGRIGGKLLPSSWWPSGAALDGGGGGRKRTPAATPTPLLLCAARHGRGNKTKANGTFDFSINFQCVNENALVI